MKTISILKHNLMRATMTLAIMMTCAMAWAQTVQTVQTYYIDENGARHDTTATLLTDSPNTVYNLAPETSYIVKVRDNCNGDGLSEWTSTVEFTTMSTCTVEEVTISNITHHAATVNWTGESQKGYTVRYRTAAQADGLTAGFNSTIETDEWTKYSGLLADVMNGTITPTQCELGWKYNNTLVFGDNHATLNIYGSGCRYWLVSPFVNNLSSGSKLEFDLALTAYKSGDTIQVPNGQTDDRFVVLIQSGDSLHILREWNNTGSEYIYNKIPNTGQHVSIDIPAPYYGNTVKIVFYGESTVFVENEDNDLHIDNVIFGVHMPAGEWKTVAATSEASAADISGLDPNRKYEVVVSSNCNENLRSDMISFSTVSANRKWFITAGNWGNPDNWEPTGVPNFEQNVVLKANATIESGCVAQAKNIIGTGTNEGSYTLTIEDGGKLKHFNDGVLATVKKHIAAHTETAGWYLITNPLISFVYPTEVENMIADPAENYDLYKWDYSYANEWQNYKNPEGPFYESILYNGMYGYLYANAEDTDLSFTGIIRQFNDSEYTSCECPDDPQYYDFPGWYLLGNPFVYDAYLISGDGYPVPYYRMNAARNGFEAVAAGTPIAPMEGYFFHASNEEGGWTGLLHVTTTEPAQPRTGNLNMTVSQGRSTKDNAILHFGEGYKLEKFSFGESSSKIYFSQGGKDYAIVTSDGVGEMLLNFTATENGQYTIMVNPENVEMGYLHLIDNMNGADVDLLEMPSYTFTATTTDYENRFKLVFASKNEDGPSTGSGTFAFYSNGNWIISNEDEATLQVIDITGRILSSETVNGSVSKAIHAAAGVYMLRLINGVDVRTQKIIIE